MIFPHPATHHFSMILRSNRYPARQIPGLDRPADELVDGHLVLPVVSLLPGSPGWRAPPVVLRCPRYAAQPTGRSVAFRSGPTVVRWQLSLAAALLPAGRSPECQHVGCDESIR